MSGTYILVSNLENYLALSSSRFLGVHSATAILCHPWRLFSVS